MTGDNMYILCMSNLKLTIVTEIQRKPFSLHGVVDSIFEGLVAKKHRLILFSLPLKRRKGT